MRVLVLRAADGASTSVVVVDERSARALRRLRLALDARDAPWRARPPPGPVQPGAELKVELAGDLLCLEYREP